MTWVGDCCVRCCTSVHMLPAEFLCVILFLTQAGIMDYFLVSNLSIVHVTWVIPDAVNLIVLVSSIYVSYFTLHKDQQENHSIRSFAWVSWLLINIIVAAKTIFMFNEFANKLVEEDPSFFGPNTLKTSIALASCIFMLLLTTQHDAPLGSDRRLYIEELTGTVVFDLIDTVDILEILFDGNKTDSFWDGLYEFILAVATINLLIPTVPLLVLSRTKFGYYRLQKRLVYAHRLIVVIAVNVPNLMVRFIVWHGFSGAISPFSLKNIILISITLYEFYLHKKAKFEEHEKERIEMEGINEKPPPSSDKVDFSKSVDADDECVCGERPDDNCTCGHRSEASFNMESRIETHL